MPSKQRMTIEQAAHEVNLASRRIALLHLAFSRAAVARLGDEAGRKLIINAIKRYGMLVGEEVRAGVLRQGLDLVPENYGAGDARSLPNIGMHAGTETVEEQGRTRRRAYGCAMAAVWREYGDEQLGRLYCLVDSAKFMAFNPEFTMSHTKAVPDGDPFCEFCIRRTTAQERSDFASDDADWTYIDNCSNEESTE